MVRVLPEGMNSGSKPVPVVNTSFFWEFMPQRIFLTEYVML